MKAETGTPCGSRVTASQDDQMNDCMRGGKVWIRKEGCKEAVH